MHWDSTNGQKLLKEPNALVDYFLIGAGAIIQNNKSNKNKVPKLEVHSFPGLTIRSSEGLL